MDRIRNNDWQDNISLKDSIENYLRRGFQRKEILLYMRRDFPEYAWKLSNLRSTNNILQFIKKEQPIHVTLLEARDAVTKEIAGPGCLLGYQAMHQKLRQVHGINVPRDVVYALMGDINPGGLESRQPVKKKKKDNIAFSSPGPNFVHSLDGHDKMMGFQNWTFPLAIYGCLDTCSWKLLWVKVWNNNSNQKYPGRWYIDYVRKVKLIPRMIRIDKGSETVKLTSIYAQLLNLSTNLNTQDAVESVIYGSSTSNKIERWWRDLHERLELYFKHPLKLLKSTANYIPESKLDIIAYIVIPILQREIDTFVSMWNNYRMLKQKGTELPDGMPDHIYAFPEEYNLVGHDIPVREEDIDATESLANIAQPDEDYLDEDFCL